MLGMVGQAQHRRYAGTVDVRIQHAYTRTQLLQRNGQVDRGRRLADAALAGGDYDDFSQRTSPDDSVWVLRQSSAAILIWSCSSHTCTALPRRLSGTSSSTL
ncbi:hypothetical protein G6F59_017498 [Rhizopus arrhizus]|nr:hypothetical protein G6F59_017498 [Rhizopus arrhizus]